MLRREKAILGITVVDESDRVVGHASFTDAPPVPGVRPEEWHTWFHKVIYIICLLV